MTEPTPRPPGQTETTLVRAEGAAWITLDRPESRNALSPTLVAELRAHIEAASTDPALRALVLTGAGSAFCAGADLKLSPGGAVGGRPEALPELLTALLDCPKPVLAMVNGAAYAGGLGLVAACDLVVTAEDAPFAFSEVRLGVIPAIISVVCVPKLGVHQAMRLFLTGERFDGREAVRLGLAHHAVPAGELRAALSAQLAMLRLAGPAALAEAKRLIRRISRLSVAEGFSEAAPWSARLFASEEAREGMAAFRERRPPAWAVTEP